jgi:phenylalanine-4-hydroxylase
MTESTHAKIPVHLRKYIVEQNYERYTPEDHAVWRYILHQLKSFLSTHAHESYSEGLIKTGITVDRIPRIDDIDEHLERFGWGAVPVSGFIPPAAFMEFQSIGVLPIASDMRTVGHLMYTPAPDIVHEAAGHAPILVHPEYAAYLRQYGEVARSSIISKEDLDQYEAIRVLSDIKEDPRSTKNEIARAEQRLSEVNQSLRNVSEAALLSRMNWWTAEYGLIGDLKQPKIFGAGLLSSVGEARGCLSDKVKKIPLSVDCVDFSYDITEPQPQLFVARDFAQLGEVLEDLAKRLSYRRGGVFALNQAKEARTVNTIELDSGLQISGMLTDFILKNDEPVYLQFTGPSQLALAGQELNNQGTKRHPQGFGSPLGRPRTDLSRLKPSERTQVEFETGVKVQGVLKDSIVHNGHLVLMTWSDCKVTLEGRTMFEPAWGEYDMAVGQTVKSVFGGPADRSRFGTTEDFTAKRVPARKFSRDENDRFAAFQSLCDLRQKNVTAATRGLFQKHLASFLNAPEPAWLIGVELLEVASKFETPAQDIQRLREKLTQLGIQDADQVL